VYCRIRRVPSSLVSNLLAILGPIEPEERILHEAESRPFAHVSFDPEEVAFIERAVSKVITAGTVEGAGLRAALHQLRENRRSFSAHDGETRRRLAGALESYQTLTHPRFGTPILRPDDIVEAQRLSDKLTAQKVED
jgi:hypothetical protein